MRCEMCSGPPQRRRWLMVESNGSFDAAQCLRHEVSLVRQKRLRATNDRWERWVFPGQTDIEASGRCRNIRSYHRVLEGKNKTYNVHRRERGGGTSGVVMTFSVSNELHSRRMFVALLISVQEMSGRTRSFNLEHNVDKEWVWCI